MTNRFLISFAVVFVLVMVSVSVILYKLIPDSRNSSDRIPVEISWSAPDINQLPHTADADLVRYGRELIINTSKYLGPKGTIARISNGMDCQHCHIDAGTRLYGNTFAMVAASYPKYRDRSGKIESVEYRVNECMERSLNGEKLDSLSKEMKAMVAYLKWVGKGLSKEDKPKGVHNPPLAFMERAANPANGKIIYITKCQRCHGANGEGSLKPDSVSYFYPPLWGPNSYNVSAGMYRLSHAATFIKYNMPFTKDYREPQLTDEEAWDVGAFVNSQQRTEKFFPYDWPKISSKPVDYPFGPFADNFSATQHKYGPFIGMKK